MTTKETKERLIQGILKNSSYNMDPVYLTAKQGLERMTDAELSCLLSVIRVKEDDVRDDEYWANFRTD